MKPDGSSGAAGPSSTRGLALLGCAVLIGLVAFLWLRTRTEDNPGLAPTDPVAAPRDSASAAVPDAQTDAPASRTALVAATSRPTTDSADELVTLRGRCVAAEDSRPLAGIKVSFRGRASNRELARLRGEQPLGVPNPYVTREDGRFELRFTAYSHFTHQLSLQGEGRAPRYGWFNAFAPGTQKDLGDLPLERGFAVSGFVTDPQGAPVADVGISLSRQGRPSEPIGAYDPSGGVVWGNGKSDAAGTFTIRNLTPGTYPLSVEGSAFEHLAPKEVEVQPEVGASGIHVIVRRRLSIEGTIVDENGAPSDLEANLIAWSRVGQLGSLLVTATSDKDGVFRLFLLAGSAEPVQIGWERSRVREGFRTREWIEWGARNVRLVAKRLPSLELEVVEAETGKPVEEFAVRAWNEKDWYVDLPWNPGRSPDGHVRLAGLAPGETFVEVIPKRTDLLTSAPLRVRVSADAHGPVRIELLRATSFSVRVLFADRSPVAEAMVELLDPRQLPLINHETTAFDDRLALGPGGPGSTVSGGSRERMLALLAWGTTDAEGRAVLHGPATGPRFALRVSSAAHVPLIVDDFRIPKENGEAEVFVAAGANLDFVVRPPAVVRYERCGIRLRKAGATSLVVYPSQGTSFLFGWKETARARRVPAGTWEVLLSTKDAALEPPLATVTLEEGKTTRLEVDLSHLLPARLSGKVLCNGARPVTGSVTLAAKFVQLTVPLDAAGRFVAERVLPGTYELSAALALEREGLQCAHDRFLELAPGADLDIDFDLRPRTLHLRVLQHDGAPARNVLGDVAGGLFTVKFATDERGAALVSPVPGPKVRVTAGNQVVFDSQVSAGPDPELTVRLPEPEKK